jgi:UDP-N-acetylglucosamine 2-epimerase (non-hydrolysing)
MLELFSVPVSKNLMVMEVGQRLGAVTARILAGVEADLVENSPDWVIVQGDTATAFAAALAGFYLRIPVAHVEAGLRTNNIDNPFPEEANRRFITGLSQLHFAPTEQARQNLIRERVAPESIHVTGNTGIDALLEIAGREPDGERSRTGGNAGRLILVTAHRRETFGAGLLGVCAALRTLAYRNPDVHIVYALHPNPNVNQPVRRELTGVPRIELVEALDYVSFVSMMKRSFLILTDSGGIQEEAPSLHKPVLVLRDHSERIEALAAGTARLVGTSPDRIVSETEWLLRDPTAWAAMTQADNPYGDGHAAERIVSVLLGKG